MLLCTLLNACPEHLLADASWSSAQSTQLTAFIMKELNLELILNIWAGHHVPNGPYMQTDSKLGQWHLLFILNESWLCSPAYSPATL